jgi:hypothetical protein
VPHSQRQHGGEAARGRAVVARAGGDGGIVVGRVDGVEEGLQHEGGEHNGWRRGGREGEAAEHVEGPREVDESGLQPDRRTKMNEKFGSGHAYASRSAAVPLKRGESFNGVEVLRNKMWSGIRASS